MTTLTAVIASTTRERDVEEPAAPAAYAWLGYRASIWAHRGYRVEGERVLCSDLDDARRVVAESLGCPLDELVCEVGDGEHYYLSQEDADRDSDGSSAEAVVGAVE